MTITISRSSTTIRNFAIATVCLLCGLFSAVSSSAATGTLVEMSHTAMIGSKHATSNRSSRSHKKKKRRHKSRRPRHRFDGYAYLGLYYDDNVFNYSDSDRQTFEGRTQPLERFPIESLDDFVAVPAVRVDYLWKIRRHSDWRVRAMADAQIYTSNTIKNYSRFGLSLRRRVRDGSVALALRYTPSYYLRHLFWRQMPERPAGVRFAAAQFNKFSLALDSRYNFSPAWVGLFGFDFAYRNYDFPFDERDNSTYSIAAGARYRASRALRLKFLASVGWSRAKGPNQVPGALADISNNQYGFQGGFTWRISGGLRLDETLVYSHQSYTTSNPLDTAHFDRRDKDIHWSNRLYWRIDRHWQPQVFYVYRNSSTSVDSPLYFDVGQYRGNRAGVQVNYFF